MNQGTTIRLTSKGPRYILSRMKPHPKDARSDAEKARDTAGIVGSLKHEGYVHNADDEAIHQKVKRGEITSDEAIELFAQRGLERERKALARQRKQPA